jgi:methionyl-tRNA formyltransferase
VNLHFSLLPAWRGAAPVQHAIMAGDELTGAATFRLEAGLDTGPVFGVVTEPIGPRDTAGDLLGRLAVSGAGLLVATLDGIADGSLVAEPQSADGISLAPRIEPGELAVDSGQVLVGTGNGAVVLDLVQPAGKRMLPAADWSRGARPVPGERVGT